MSDPLWSLAAPQLRDLPTYETGKPIEETARELGLDPAAIVKLASNENPLGPSPLAREAMRAALDQAHLYPDGGGWKLRSALARKHGLALENIVLGNGSNEIFEFLGRAFFGPGAEVIAARHAFVVYALMTRLCGATFVEVDDPGFTHDLPAMLAAITPRTRAVIVANPNNPTGTIVPAAALDDFVARVPDHVVTVIDEAYYEFLDAPPDTLRHVREGKKNVVLLRTFSKIQGLAAVRVGYGMARPALIEVLQKTRQPFNVNAVAQAGALAGVGDEEHQRRSKELTAEGRAHRRDRGRQDALPPGMRQLVRARTQICGGLGDAPGHAVAQPAARGGSQPALYLLGDAKNARAPGCLSVPGGLEGQVVEDVHATRLPVRARKSSGSSEGRPLRRVRSFAPRRWTANRNHRSGIFWEVNRCRSEPLLRTCRPCGAARASSRRSVTRTAS